MPDKRSFVDVSVLSNSPGFLPIKWGLSKPQGSAAAASADKHFLQRHLESPREKMKGPAPRDRGRGADCVCARVCVCVCVRTRLGRGRCAETGLDTDWQIGRGQEDGESTTTTETGEKNRGRQSSTESSLGTLKTVAVTTCDMMPPCLLRAPPLGLAVPG